MKIRTFAVTAVEEVVIILMEYRFTVTIHVREPSRLDFVNKANTLCLQTNFWK